MSRYLYVVVLRDKYPSASFYAKKDAEAFVKSSMDRADMSLWRVPLGFWKMRGAFGMDMFALRVNGEKL